MGFFGPGRDHGGENPQNLCRPGREKKSDLRGLHLKKGALIFSACENLIPHFLSGLAKIVQTFWLPLPAKLKAHELKE